MSRRKKDPPRGLTAPQRRELTRLSRSRETPAVEVIRAGILPAVARGDDYRDEAHAVGRRSGDAVPPLVTRFNAEGLAATAPRHGGGRWPTCSSRARALIAAEAAREPTPLRDGTATRSLSTPRRTPHAAPDGRQGRDRACAGLDRARLTVRHVSTRAGIRPPPWHFRDGICHVGVDAGNSPSGLHRSPIHASRRPLPELRPPPAR